MPGSDETLSTTEVKDYSAVPLDPVNPPTQPGVSTTEPPAPPQPQPPPAAETQPSVSGEPTTTGGGEEPLTASGVVSGLENYIDPSLLEALRESARGDMSVGEAFGYAGLAAANPEMARFLLGTRSNEINQARSTLAQLQQNVSMFLRERERLTASDERLIAQANSKAIQEGLKALAGSQTPYDPPPTDFYDTKAVHEWLTKNTPLMKENEQRQQTLEVQKEKRRAFSGAMEEIRKQTVAGMMPDDPEQIKQITAGYLFQTGAADTPEEAMSIASSPDTMAVLSSLTRQQRQAQLEQDKAYTALLRQRRLVAEADVDRIRASLKKGDIHSVQNAAALYSARVRDVAQLQDQLAWANQQVVQWMGANDATKNQPWYQRGLAQAMTRYNDLEAMYLQERSDLTELGSALQRNAGKINFAENYASMFDRHLDEVILSDPSGSLMQSPNPRQMALALISQPGSSQLKDQFWVGLAKEIRAEYGVGMSEALQLVFEQLAQQKQQLGMSSALPQQAEMMQYWKQAAPAAGTQPPPQTFQPGTEIPGPGMWERGPGSWLRGITGGNLPIPMPAEPSVQQQPIPPQPSQGQ